MKKLYNGRLIPNQINTDVRVFQVQTYDGDIFLCNVETAQEVIKADECKSVKHYWNYSFKVISKSEVLTIG